MSGNDREVEVALRALETEAVNFGYRLTKDAATRQWYIQKTQEMTTELRARVRSGELSPRRAAEMAQEMRNEIMEAARARTSDMGRAGARQLKAKGRALDELIDKYAQRKYSRGFQQLTQGQQDEVLLEIVDAAGRQNPKVNARQAKLGALGRGLWVLSAVIAVYNISVAEDKAHATGREVANVAGGFAGGAMAGAAAGIWFGPIGVAVGVAVGGVVGSLIADEAYTELTPPKDPRVRNILPRFTGFWSFDEDGLAKALYDEAGIDLDRVSAVFREINQDHSGDADAAAYAYVREVKRRGGPPLHALRLNSGLRQQLSRALQSGWWVTDAEKREAQALLRM